MFLSLSCGCCVQVLIRIRPLNNIEKLEQGYDRCLRQENAQTLVWAGHPETRFTFDHIACETLSQVRNNLKQKFCLVNGSLVLNVKVIVVSVFITDNKELYVSLDFILKSP